MQRVTQLRQACHLPRKLFPQHLPEGNSGGEQLLDGGRLEGPPQSRLVVVVVRDAQAQKQHMRFQTMVVDTG